MNDVEYLKAVREADKEWVADFHSRYEFPTHKFTEDVSAEDHYEAASHHIEYAPSSH